jgi:hypothetical protein
MVVGERDLAASCNAGQSGLPELPVAQGATAAMRFSAGDSSALLAPERQHQRFGEADPAHADAGSVTSNLMRAMHGSGLS